MLHSCVTSSLIGESIKTQTSTKKQYEIHAQRQKNKQPEKKTRTRCGASSETLNVTAPRTCPSSNSLSPKQTQHMASTVIPSARVRLGICCRQGDLFALGCTACNISFISCHNCVGYPISYSDNYSRRSCSALLLPGVCQDPQRTLFAYRARVFRGAYH